MGALSIDPIVPFKASLEGFRKVSTPRKCLRNLMLQAGKVGGVGPYLSLGFRGLGFKRGGGFRVLGSGPQQMQRFVVDWPPGLEEGLGGLGLREVCLCYSATGSIRGYY